MKTTIRQLMAQHDILGLPGVFDGISARAAETVGFPAMYMTGYGAVASALGVPDAGLATYSDMLDRVRCIAAAISVPFIADADTGYGGLLNVERTVRGYEAAGVAGIQLEDQEFPKKCGHTQGRRVIPAADAARKIKVAAASRDSGDFLIVARTDARTGHGLDEALRRAELFLRAGADILFVESPESVEELRRIGTTFRGVPLLANMVEGGRTPYLPTAELAALGFKIAIFPSIGFLAAAQALRDSYTRLKDAGTGAGGAKLLPFSEMNAMMGFPRVWAFDAEWAEGEGA